MDSPIEKIIEWYESLPVEHRNEIAVMASEFGIGPDDIDILSAEGAPEKFVAYVRNSPSNRQRAVGLILSVRSFIDFFFIRMRSSKPDWQRSQQVMEEMYKKTGNPQFQKSANEIPFRRQQWSVTCEKWDELKASHLADLNLDVWFMHRG